MAETGARYYDGVEIASLGRSSTGSNPFLLPFFPAQWDQHAAGALHDERVAVTTQLSHARFHVCGIQGRTCALGGNRWRERLAKLQERCGQWHSLS
jgi:hypothetical protein